jgi:hypothetical protein
MLNVLECRDVPDSVAKSFPLLTWEAAIEFCQHYQQNPMSRTLMVQSVAAMRACTESESPFFGKMDMRALTALINLADKYEVEPLHGMAIRYLASLILLLTPEELRKKFWHPEEFTLEEQCEAYEAYKERLGHLEFMKHWAEELQVAKNALDTEPDK